MYNEETPCLKQLIDCYNQYKTTILGVQSVTKENVSKYSIVDGILVEDRVCKVKGLVKSYLLMKPLLTL